MVHKKLNLRRPLRFLTLLIIPCVCFSDWKLSTNINSIPISSDATIYLKLDCAGCYINWKLISVDRTTDILESNNVVPTIVQNPCNISEQVAKLTLQIPRSGLWYIEVQSCNTTECSEFVNSTIDNVGTIANCKPGTFYIHAYVPKPGGIGF